MSVPDRRGKIHHIVTQLDAHCGQTKRNGVLNINLDLELPIFHSPLGSFNNCAILKTPKDVNSVNYLGITYLYGETARDSLIPVIRKGEGMLNITSQMPPENVGDSVWGFLPCQEDFDLYKKLYNNKIIHMIDSKKFIPPLIFCGPFTKKSEMHEKIIEMIIKKSINNNPSSDLVDNSLDPSKLEFNLPETKLEKLSTEDKASYYRRQMLYALIPSGEIFNNFLIAENIYNRVYNDKRAIDQNTLIASYILQGGFAKEENKKTTPFFEQSIDGELLKAYEKKYIRCVIDSILSTRIHHLGIVKKTASPGQSVLVSF